MRPVRIGLAPSRVGRVLLATAAIMVVLPASSAFAATVVVNGDDATPDTGGCSSVPAEDPCKTQMVSRRARASVNGCSFSPDYPTRYRFPFKRSCNGHDRCYEQFHSFSKRWKRHCDRRFHKSLKRVCRRVRHRGHRRLCYDTAWAYYQAVKLFGGSAYRSAQKRGSLGDRPNYAVAGLTMPWRDGASDGRLDAQAA